MMKIYISPSEQEYNRYSAGNTTEEEQCHRIGEATKTALLRCGFDVKKAPLGQAAERNVEESNAWEADIHLCIHTNAGGGHGCVVFVKDLDDKHMKYAKPVYDEVAAITTAKESYGVRVANFYEIKYTDGLCVYCECEFHDNATDAQWIIDHVTELGEAICKGLCKAAGVNYVDPKTEADDKQVQLFMTRAELKQLIREVIEEDDPTMKTIADVPASLKPEVRKLLDREAINGGTSKAVNADDLNMRYSDVRVAVIAQRLMEGK